MQIQYPTIGICGLSCRLCPAYNAGVKSWCDGCKREKRITVGCPFITCALNKKGVEFCWDCEENRECERWLKHRNYGKKADSFKCYQTLEEDIAFIQKNGVDKFEREQKNRERLLKEMLQKFNEGRSKNYFCIAATVLDIKELKEAITIAKKRADGLDIKEKSKVLHTIFDDIAKTKNYCLKLRK